MVISMMPQINNIMKHNSQYQAHNLSIFMKQLNG